MSGTPGPRKKLRVYFHLGLLYRGPRTTNWGNSLLVGYQILRGELSEVVETAFCEMGRLAFEESSFRGLVEVDEGQLLEVARKFAVEDGHVLMIALDEDRPVGVFAGHTSDFYFSSDKFARDVLWYVREEYRKFGVGLGLLGLFEEWARLENAKMVYLSQDSGINVDKFNRILGKRGYNLVGSNYSLGVS